MKNRVLGLAVMAAAGLSMSVSPAMQPRSGGTEATPLSPTAQSGMQAPQGGISTLLRAILDGGAGTKPPRTNFRRGGYSVAQGKRRARKRRNVQRARRHFRAAVR